MQKSVTAIRQHHNLRADVSAKKYKKQIEWRRNKVHQLQTRGYSQYEISKLLHLSQPTISRDIAYCKKQNLKARSNEEIGTDLEEMHQKTIAGLTELLKNTWETIEGPKTDPRQKLKAIALARQLHTQLFGLTKMEYDISEMKEYAQYLDKRAEQLVREEQEITRKKKVLQDYLKQHNVDFDEIDPMSERKF